MESTDELRWIASKSKDYPDGRIRLQRWWADLTSNVSVPENPSGTFGEWRYENPEADDEL